MAYRGSKLSECPPGQRNWWKLNCRTIISVLAFSSLSALQFSINSIKAPRRTFSRIFLALPVSQSVGQPPPSPATTGKLLINSSLLTDTIHPPTLLCTSLERNGEPGRERDKTIPPSLGNKQQHGTSMSFAYYPVCLGRPQMYIIFYIIFIHPQRSWGMRRAELQKINGKYWQ